MSRKKCILILEDNESYREDFFKLFYKLDKDVKLIFFAKIGEAVKYLQDNKVDLLFVDIKMDSDKGGEHSGVYFARRIRNYEEYYVTPIVFVSPKAEVPLDILKNISFCTLFEGYKENKKLEKVLKRLLPEKEGKQWITFRIRGICYHFNAEDIVYGEIYKRTFNLKTNKEMIQIPYLSMKEFLKKVSSCSIHQCHRSFAVNMDYISHIDLSEDKIILSASFGCIDIGNTYKKSILQKFEKES